MAIFTVGLCVVFGTATQITTIVRNGFLETNNKDKPLPVGNMICVLEAYRRLENYQKKDYDVLTSSLRVIGELADTESK